MPMAAPAKKGGMPMGKRRTKHRKSGITEQNKDVVSKLFGETMRDQSLKVYGIDVPKIVDIRPTNLPAIETNEKRMDNFYLLEDGSYALLDYESKYLIANKLKYGGYVIRLLRRLQEEKVDLCSIRIRIIIIYTADVTRAQTQDTLHAGDLIISTTEGFLQDIPSEEVKKRIQGKLDANEPLDERDLMELIVLPLTYKGKDRQRQAAREAVELAKHIKDDAMQTKALAGILSFADKVIDNKLANEIRRCISMTKVGAIIAREMEESEERGITRGREEGRMEGRAEERLQTIQRFIEKGFDKDFVQSMGYSEEEYVQAEQSLLINA